MAALRFTPSPAQIGPDPPDSHVAQDRQFTSAVPVRIVAVHPNRRTGRILLFHREQNCTSDTPGKKQLSAPRQRVGNSEHSPITGRYCYLTSQDSLIFQHNTATRRSGTISMHITHPKQLNQFSGKRTAIFKTQLQPDRLRIKLNVTRNTAFTVKVRYLRDSCQR